MGERRIAYLLLLVLCLIFYWAYRQWLSWLVLMAVVWLPWLSLVLSLPAMLTCNLQVQCPGKLTAGDGAAVNVTGKSPFPIPGIRVKLLVRRALTGQQWKLSSGDKLPSDHCGFLEVTIQKAWCYDYLGLFRAPVRRKEHGGMLVMPSVAIVEDKPDVSRYMANAWRPKPGGGFSENHELRLYRPGDNLRQVHWKLSAKTGKLVYREPMEALRGLAVLTVRLSGTPDELDDKLGKLRYLSNWLLSQDIPHHICALTGSGLVQQAVEGEGDVERGLSTLLRCTPAREDMRFGYLGAAWRCHVGGDADEG